MNLHERASSICFGTASGFTVGGLLETLRSPSTSNLLAFLGSLVSTAAGIWIAERQRSDRGRADRAAAVELRDAVRELAAQIQSQPRPLDPAPIPSPP